jgi:hypothetical protein
MSGRRRYKGGRDQSLPAPTPVRHILARPGEAAFPEEVRQNWSPPDQSEFNRRVALAQLRRRLVARLPVDTAALPVKSRLRRPAPSARKGQGTGTLPMARGWPCAPTLGGVCPCRRG